MGKVKHLMRSLRTRFSPSKVSANCSHSSDSGSSLSSAQTNNQRTSTLTIQTRATSYDDVQKSPKTASIVHPNNETHNNEALASGAIRGLAKEYKVEKEVVLLSAHAELDVNVAMLDFAKRLPLKELNMVGTSSALSLRHKSGVSKEEAEAHAPIAFLSEPQTRSRTLSLTSRSSASSWSFASHPTRRIQQHHAKRECVHAESVPRDEVEVVFPRVALQSDTGLRVLSLETGSSGSAWSFACRSARHIERHRAQSEHNDDSSSFGSLVGWGVTQGCDGLEGIDCQKDHTNLKDRHRLEPTILAHKFDHPQRNTFYRPARRSTNDTMKVQRALAIDGAWGAGFGDTPMRSDAHYERTPSFTRRSFDSCDLFLQSIDLPAPAQNHEGMTDAEFEALPDWSDVEDDPEYNYSMKSSFCWSNTASSWSYKPLAEGHPWMMSEAEFEALPDWSDVENDPEYNQFEERSFCWSTSASSYSSKCLKEMIGAMAPTVHVLSGYLGARTKDVQDHATWGDAPAPTKTGTSEVEADK